MAIRYLHLKTTTIHVPVGACPFGCVACANMAHQEITFSWAEQIRQRLDLPATGLSVSQMRTHIEILEELDRAEHEGGVMKLEELHHSRLCELMELGWRFPSRQILEMVDAIKASPTTAMDLRSKD